MLRRGASTHNGAEQATTQTQANSSEETTESKKEKRAILNKQTAQDMTFLGVTQGFTELGKTFTTYLSSDPSAKTAWYVFQGASSLIVLRRGDTAPQIKWGHFLLILYSITQTALTLYFTYAGINCVNNADTATCKTNTILDEIFLIFSMCYGLFSGAALANEKRIEKKKLASIAAASANGSAAASLDPTTPLRNGSRAPGATAGGDSSPIVVNHNMRGSQDSLCIEPLRLIPRPIPATHLSHQRASPTSLDALDSAPLPHPPLRANHKPAPRHLLSALVAQSVFPPDQDDAVVIDLSSAASDFSI